MSCKNFREVEWTARGCVGRQAKGEVLFEVIAPLARDKTIFFDTLKWENDESGRAWFTVWGRYAVKGGFEADIGRFFRRAANRVSCSLTEFKIDRFYSTTPGNMSRV